MKTIVGVKFKKPGKMYYFDPQDLQLEPGTKVIVETALGDEYGEIIVGNKETLKNSPTYTRLIEFVENENLLVDI